MTAVQSVVSGRGSETGIFPHTTWPILSDRRQRSLDALRRSAQFWAEGAPDKTMPGVPPLLFDEDLCTGPSWLMRRPAGRPAAATFDSGPPAAFVELRGVDELASAYQVAAEAFGVADAKFAPRRLTLLPEPLHLRTWALFRDSRVLCCALSVVVDDVMVMCAVATRPAIQGHGLGSRIVRELHRLHERTEVVREFVVCSPLAAVPGFERLGYDVVMDRHR